MKKEGAFLRAEITLPDGSKGVGEFREGRSWNIIEYDKDGNIIGKWVNGEQQ